jgi:hypothetical protein
MDQNVYSEAVINRFIKKNLFFGDATLERYYINDDVTSFRKRVHRLYKNQSFEKIVYALVTDSVRDIIYQIIGELSEFLYKSGDLVISGGEAFNFYMERKDRLITSDIDTKFVPKFKYDNKYFGKLQAVKLLLWDKLGEIATRYDKKIRARFQAKTKIAKFVGLGFSEKGPHVKRRYSLIKKKKSGNGPEPSKGDVFIDVELFALDLKIRYYSCASGKIIDTNIGGILDIPLMRPGEFGYEVVESKKKGVTYTNKVTGSIVKDDRIFVAGRRFLIDDVFLMHKLGLRPEKKEKDRQRMIKMAKIITKQVNFDSSDSMQSVYDRVHKVKMTPLKRRKTDGIVSIADAMKINPRKYEAYTTPPDEKRIAKQFVYGLKASTPTMRVQGFAKTYGNQRFNLNNQLWVRNKSSNYVKNEYNFRPTELNTIPEQLQIKKTLYGYRPIRDKWIPDTLVKKAAQIPFVGLKK